MNNWDEIIDSRDVIARIEELTIERDAHNERVQEIADALSGSRDDLEEAIANYNQGHGFYSEDDATELASLEDLKSQAECCSDWEYGETLIRESYFEEYARQFASDIGAINEDSNWPNCHIDWEAAADALKQDYTGVDFDGETYLIRS
jgi:hypothetical protein